MTEQEKVQRDRVIEAVFPVIADRMGWHHRIDNHPPRNTNFACDIADAAIAAMQKDAAMDRLVAEGQRCDAMTPQETCCPDLTYGLPWDEKRGELLLEVHHILTEPVCPTVKLSWETSGEVICCVTADTIEEGIRKALNHNPEIARAISEDSHE